MNIRLQFHQFGSPKDVLTVENIELAPLKSHEVRVKMIARPMNPSDLIPITGAYAHRIPLPTIPGYEGVGVVEAVGSLVDPLLISKRVLPLRGEGTWQSFVTTSHEYVVVVPESIDDFTAAQLYINPLTAFIICTETLQLKSGDTVLVNACGSAIGRIFAQLSKVLGFRLIAITRNDKHTEELLKLGATHVINTATSPLQQTVLNLTNGRGADAAIDSIGGVDGNELAYSVRPQGIFLALGLLSGIQVNWAEIANKAQVNGQVFHLRHWNAEVSAKDWQQTFKTIFTFIESGQLHLMPASATFDLIDFKEAIHYLEYARGKVMLTSTS